MTAVSLILLGLVDPAAEYHNTDAWQTLGEHMKTLLGRANDNERHE